MKGPTMRVAFEGCGHGKLHDIYASVKESAKQKGWDGVDLVVIGGDFQAVRNSNDLTCMSVPAKYKLIGDFQEYYSGVRVAPYLTVFVGGNHEASSHLFELYYGGWVAPNIYYLGASSVIRCGPLRIAGMSGIYYAQDYKRPHHERLPYRYSDTKSIYHVRELEVRKLLQIRTQVDLGLSHDWPDQAVFSGDVRSLLRAKPHFRPDVESGGIGSPAAQAVLEHLRPQLWFSAHLHCKYVATIDHNKKQGGVASLPWPVSGPAPEKKKEGITANQEEISAWQQFYEVAAKQEAEDTRRYLDNLTEHNRRVEAGEETNVSGATYNLTWKKVAVGNDPLDRQVTDVIKSDKGKEKGPGVKNDDEIDLDLDSDSGASVHEATETVQPGSNSEQSTSNPEHEKPSSPPVAVGEDVTTVADDLTQKVSKPAEQAEQDADTPSGISNEVTNFLALDKCLPRHSFLQLVDLPVVSKPDPVHEKRPYELKYDKEWLAITRAFANELVLGDPSAPVPAHKGDDHYEKEVRTAEQWVEENIVKQDKMTIPHNFSITAPVYDPSISVWTTDQPLEYMNPQTEQFCNLLGIDNKFKMTDAEKQAQNDAISNANVLQASRPQDGGRQHDRGGHHGRRGRGRGRGRGGFRGRGRGWD